MIFRPFGAKLDMENDPHWPPLPPSMEFSIIFLIFFLNPSLTEFFYILWKFEGTLLWSAQYNEEWNF